MLYHSLNIFNSIAILLQFAREQKFFRRKVIRTRYVKRCIFQCLPQRNKEIVRRLLGEMYLCIIVYVSVNNYKCKYCDIVILYSENKKVKEVISSYSYLRVISYLMGNSKPVFEKGLTIFRQFTRVPNTIFKTRIPRGPSKMTTPGEWGGVQCHHI